MASEQDVASGLLNWLNSLGTSTPIPNVQQLNNGDAVWKALQFIDRFSFPGSLPEDPSKLDTTTNSSWVLKWSNLKHIYDALSIFIIEECGQQLPLFRSPNVHRTGPDLKAIAQHSSLPDSILLLKLCVVAASSCADRIEHLKRMQDLNEMTQKVLMETLQEAQVSDEDNDKLEDDEEQDVVPGPGEDVARYDEFDRATTVDANLASEEKLSKVIADNTRLAHEKRDLENQVDDLYSRYEQLQERFDKSQEQLDEANDRLTAVLAGKDEAGKNKSVDNEAMIATLEASVMQIETENEELKKSNEVLKIKADRVQKLQDDYDEMKIDRDKLSRKANTAEKYRQKLEATQEMERENGTLKTKISELQAQIRQNDTSRASTSDLQREIEEYKRLLPSIEQERHELNGMKKRLEFDYHTLDARYRDSVEQLQKSRIEVEDLQGRLREYEDYVSPTTPTKRLPESGLQELESEEAEFTAAESRLMEALLQNKNTEPDQEGDMKEPNEDGISEDELRAIMAAMRAQMQAGAATERESGVKIQKRLLILVEKARSRNLILAEHVQKQNGQIKDLQQVSQTVESKAPTTPRPQTPVRNYVESISGSDIDELMQVNENLKREIKLITSAWYEQNQRMAASGAGGGAVALMRSKMALGSGLEEPRSFLGIQRRMVDRALMGEETKGMKSRIGR